MSNKVLDVRSIEVRRYTLPLLRRAGEELAGKGRGNDEARMVNSEWMEPSPEVEVGSGVGGLAGCLACHRFKSGTGSSQR